MAKSKAIKKATLPTPHNVSEAAEFLRQIGECKRSIDEANNRMNAQIEEVKKPIIEEVEGHQRHLEQLVGGLLAYAQVNRPQLTDDKKKSVELPTGTFGWRLPPKSVKITNTKAVVAQLKRLQLERFIRTKEEVDKQAMLKEEKVATGIAGIEFVQEEFFFLKPAQITAELIATPTKRGLHVAVSTEEGKHTTKVSA